MQDNSRFNLQRDRTICIIVDMQTQLMSAMENRIIAMIEKNVNLCISSIKVLNVPVLVTEQYPRGLGPTCESVRQNLENQYKPIEKIVFSCWQEPDFRDKIRLLQPEKIIITGIETHVCVLQTALDLLQEGYYVHIPADATCSRYKTDWKHALNLLDSAGAVVTTVETALFQLMEKAGTGEFKAISPLIKAKT